MTFRKFSHSAMSKQHKILGKTSEFRLRGQFLGFVAPGAKLMQLATPTGEFTVKLSKELRPSLNRTLMLGDWLEVSGYQKLDDGEVKFKAEQISMLAHAKAIPTIPVSNISGSNISVSQSSRHKPEILVCQKSDCCKLGGNALMRELQAELNERGLTDIQIKGTGCLKRCKSGPNLIMPDRSRYSRIQASEVAALLDQHFPGSGEMAS